MRARHCSYASCCADLKYASAMLPSPKSWICTSNLIVESSTIWTEVNRCLKM